MPTQACPACQNPPQTRAFAAASRSASSATIVASLPPSSSRTGVSVFEQACITRRPVGTDPVNAILSTPELHSAAPVGPKPDTQPTRPRGASGFALRKDSTAYTPVAVLNS